MHSDAFKFKSKAAATCMRLDASIAAVAQAHGVHPNLLRRRMRAAQMRVSAGLVQTRPSSRSPVAGGRPAFVLAAAAPDMRAGADRPMARVPQVFGSAPRP